MIESVAIKLLLWSDLAYSHIINPCCQSVALQDTVKWYRYWTQSSSSEKRYLIPRSQPTHISYRIQLGIEDR
jgi:hypothetical protein